MLESEELRPGKAFVFSFGKVKDDASPQVHEFRNVSYSFVYFHDMFYCSLASEQHKVNKAVLAVSIRFNSSHGLRSTSS